MSTMQHTLLDSIAGDWTLNIPSAFKHMLLLVF